MHLVLYILQIPCDESMKGKSENLSKKVKITIKDITLIGMMVAVIEVCKAAFMALPNFELTTFWLIMFTLYFGRKIIFAVPVFILIEGCIFGFGLWWITYLYIWFLLVFFTWLFRKQDSLLCYSVLASAFGFLFGFFCAVPYVVIGAVNGSITSGLYAGFTWWVAGIPWDIVHGISNFVIMLVLYKPVKKVMDRLKLKSKTTGN